MWSGGGVGEWNETAAHPKEVGWSKVKIQDNYFTWRFLSPLREFVYNKPNSSACPVMCKNNKNRAKNTFRDLF